MALFTKDTIDRVRDAVDMVQLVGQKTDLRRVGTRWSGLCPFHDERTPSFSVNAEEKLYYCFGCGEGGDAFKFVQQTEALDFQEAVELLAERFGVRVEREDDDPRAEERRRRRERLHALLERATRFYAAYLRESAEAAPAREYLASRGLSDEVLAEFRVGYSPSAWDRMIMGARQSGFSEEELVAAGLAQRGQERRPLRPLPRADHVPAGGFAREGARLRRTADGGGARAEVPQHLRERPLPQGSPALRHRRGAQGGDAHRSFRGRGGLHRCACASPGGDPRGRGHHGHGAHAGAARRAGEGRRRQPPRPRLPRSRRGSSRAGCHAAGRRGSRRIGASICAWSRCRRAQIQRIS